MSSTIWTISIFVLLSISTFPLYITPQDKNQNELPPVEGNFFITYNNVSIVVQTLERCRDFHRYIPGTDRAYGPQLDAAPDEEVIVVRLFTNRSGTEIGICFSESLLRSEDGTAYSINAPRCIGTRSDRGLGPLKVEYELPLIVPKGLRFISLEFKGARSYGPGAEETGRQQVIIRLPGGM